MTDRVAGVPTPRVAFTALTRTFLRRFFDNEITGGTQDLKASFFWLIAFLAAPLALMPVGLMVGFQMILLTRGPEALRVLSRPHKSAAIVLGMTAAALIAAVVWNSLMLERRDGLILGTLPVRGRTIVLSKLAALALYVFGISAAMHAVSSVLFGIVLGDGAESWRLVLLSPLAHFAATTASCAFVFLSVTAAQGLALALTGPAIFRRVSSVFQVALVATIVVGFTQIANVIQAVSRFNQVGREVTMPEWLWLVPPIWFLGLYEWILGGAEPVYGTLAVIAMLAFGTVTLATVTTYAVVYRRVMSRVVETSEDSGGRRRVSASFEWITRRISRLPVRRAAAQFLFTSIGRVERLRFVMAVTVGVLCAWIVPALALIVGGRGAPPTPRATFTLSYAALLLVLIGLRIAISMPADLRAAWIAPMIDAPRRALRSGLWRAVFLTTVVPVTVGFAAFHAWLWDARLALMHAAVMLSVGAVLVEVALWHFDDLPSQRPWRPENANLRMWWPAYLIGFPTITGTVPQLEWVFRDSVVGTGAILGMCLLLVVALRFAHGRPYPRRSFDIETFVEPPKVLNLD